MAATNQDGAVTQFGYDGAGRLTAVTDALNQVTRYQYDQAGNEILQLDALNRTNIFAYDAMGRRIQHVMPGGQSEGFAYDLAGNQIYATNFNGAVITNLYDVMNRLTNRASLLGYRVSFGYSPTGQRTNMIDPGGATAYWYDARDRQTNKLVSFTGGPSVALSYGYDANGNVTNLWSSTTNGVNLAYSYDPLNRLTNVLSQSSSLCGYAYDPVGNLQCLWYGNGVTNQYEYDSLNRLTNNVWKTNGISIASFAYQLGLTGTRTNLNETVDGTSRTYAWRYDPLYRLTNESISAIGNLGYAYDPVGNRTNRNSISVSQLPTANYIYNPNDWLTNRDKYDSNGSTTNSAGISYQYDVLNHLTNVNSGAILMTYDGDGSRASKKVSGTTTYYLLDDRNPSGYVQVLEEWTSTGTPTLSRVYNYGLSLISQRQSGVSTNYFVFDGHGSTRLLTDIGGGIANAFAFDAYGTLIASNSPPQTAYLYCGQQLDSDLGLYLNRARYLKADTGRFWTRDTYEGDNEDPMSLHKYLYAQGDPVDHVDPSGHDIGDMLAIGDIFTSFAAMISPVTSLATVMGAKTETRSFTQGEISLAQTIYGANIDYTKSGVNYGKWKFFQTKGREMTPAGIIYTGGVTITDYSVAGSRPALAEDPKVDFADQKATFIHEMCHVWQHQHGINVETGGLYRVYKYAGPDFGTMSFDKYGVEQQAQMVQDYYLLKIGYIDNEFTPVPTPSLGTYEKIIPFLHK